MNRNYFNVFLYGALALSTATFVGCKDYDDDIDNLQNQITTNATAIAALQSLVNSGVVITNVSQTSAGVVLTTSNGSSYTLTNGADGKDADVWTIGSDGYWYKNGSKTTYAAVGQNGKDGADGKDGANGKDGKDGAQGEKGADGGFYRPNTNTGNFDYVTVDSEGKETVTPTTISWKSSTLTAVKGSKSIILSGIQGVDGTIEIPTVLELKSLVVEPEFYYQGIEAYKVKGFSYTPWTIDENVDANSDKDADKTSESYDPKQKGSKVNSVPKLALTYHLNPSVADMPEALSRYSFLSYNKEYTRAGALDMSVDAVDYVSRPGYVVVTTSLTNSAIKDINSDNQVTVIALQVKTNSGEKDTIVTSDYAALKAVNAIDLVLAESEALLKLHNQTGSDVHLFKTAGDAIADNKEVIELVYNDSVGIDLTKLVCTHYTDSIKKTEANLDDDASDGKALANGFTYEFKLVGYISGSNKTSESAHAAIKDGKIRAQMTKDGKQQEFGAEQNKATIGRRPLVRVALKDKVGNVAAVGYMKFRIVAEPTKEDKTESSAQSFGPFTMDNAYTVRCTGDSIKKELDWVEVEEQIIAKLGISKADFESDYTLDGGKSNATQYNGTAVSSTAIATGSNVGTVSQTTSDSGDHQTEVLIWTLTNNEAYQALKNGATSVTVNVRYTKTVNATKGVYEYVYVVFKWTPREINIKPNGKIDNKTGKIDNYWFERHNLSPKTGYDDVHANVTQVKSNNSSDCTFVNDILNTLYGNKITVVSDETYNSDFADANLTKGIKFAAVQDQLIKDGNDYVAYGATGTKYIITATDSVLKATYGSKTEEIVYLIAGSDATYGNTALSYNESSEFGKDLLNKADHKELAKNQTFEAKLQFVATGKCENFVNYTLNNKEFYAKFLRPVSANAKQLSELTDATNGASYTDIDLGLIDWRDKQFDVKADYTGQDGTAYDFYQFYGVTKVEADIDNATTNLNGGDLNSQRLYDVTSKDRFKLTFTNNTNLSRTSKPRFEYLNNNFVMGQADVKVPLVITYKWGEIHTSVTLRFNQTINN